MEINWIGRNKLIKLGDPPSGYYGGDMYSPQPEGWYVVSWSIPDGWTIWEPNENRWAYNGQQWICGPSEAPPRGVPGAVKMDQAQTFAEALIAQRAQAGRGRGRHRTTV